MADSGYELHSTDVDRTQDFVDYLDIPWWGNDHGAAFEPGRVTSFTAIEHNNEQFLLVWWNRDRPTEAEVQTKLDEWFRDDEDEDES